MTGDVRFGVQFPGDDTGFLSRAEIDEWISLVTECNFSHVVFGDHVLGIDAEALDSDTRQEWSSRWPGPDAKSVYTHREVFREPFIMFGYLAARCDLELVTGILVLPQRQTALVAKQAAEIDLLTGGKLRIAAGAGWNSLEFQAMGTQFRDRNEVLEEQIDLLRLFWTQEVVSYEGRFHTVVSAGIQTLPVQQPIPIWLGGGGRRTLERTGRLADGWHPPGNLLPGPAATESVGLVRAAAAKAGRDVGEIGLEPRLYLLQWGDDEVLDFVETWRKLGATHICVDTRFGGQPVPFAEHCARLRRGAQLLGLT
jgi:probable F420-dependent oxidoreductase